MLYFSYENMDCSDFQFDSLGEEHYKVQCEMAPAVSLSRTQTILIGRSFFCPSRLLLMARAPGKILNYQGLKIIPLGLLPLKKSPPGPLERLMAHV